MSRADDLLNDLTEKEIVVRTADEAVEPNIVIGEDRFITVPDELKKIAVQYDHRIETVTFDCPRYWDGADMSKMTIYVNYTREDGLEGLYIAKNVVVDEENPNIMHFDWTLTRNATGIDGKLIFLISIRRVDKEGNEIQYWNSERNDEMHVSLGLNNGESIQDKYPDIFAQMLETFDSDRETILKRADEMYAAMKKTEGVMADAKKEMLETQEMIKEVAKIATPEAMKEYTKEYYGDNPEAILDALDEFYSIATEAEIDSIINGKFVDTGDIFEEEFSLASNSDIDTILKGTYVDSGDESDDSISVSDEELNDIVEGAF